MLHQSSNNGKFSITIAPPTPTPTPTHTPGLTDEWWFWTAIFGGSSAIGLVILSVLAIGLLCVFRRSRSRYKEIN